MIVQMALLTHFVNCNFDPQRNGKASNQMIDYALRQLHFIARMLVNICPQIVRRILDRTGPKWAVLGTFGRIQSIFFNDLGGKHLAPKAEVTGSNPVGCANVFNGLYKF